jgi:hypothetical protein
MIGLNSTFLVVPQIVVLNITLESGDLQRVMEYFHINGSTKPISEKRKIHCYLIWNRHSHECSRIRIQCSK